jgi:hypothetical protein
MRSEEEERFRTGATIEELTTRTSSSEGRDSFITACDISPSLKDLQKVSRCSDKAMPELERKMLAIVMFDSMEIWRENGRKMEQGVRENVKEMVQEEVERIEMVEV